MKIKKILVSQPKPASEKSPYFDIEKKYNTKITFRPLIKVEGLTLKEYRAQKVEVLDHTAIIFSARHAVDNFFRLCKEMRLTIPEDMKYFCMSEAVALYMQNYIQFRKRKIFSSPTGKFEDLVPLIKKHSKEKFLLAVADVTKDNQSKLLDAQSINYSKAAFYKTVADEFRADEDFDYDMIVFFSPEGINSLLKSFPNYEQGETIIASFGINTAKAVTDAGLRLDISAPNPQAPSMTGAIELFFKENKVNKK